MGRPFGAKDKTKRKDYAPREKMRVERRCASCSSLILLHPYRVKQAQKFYCNPQCRRTARTVNCDWCAAEFTKVPAVIRNHNFCSTVCMGKFQTRYRSGENSKHFLGYKKYYGANWNHQRNLARERDGYKCRSCGVSEGEKGKQHDVHHIVAFNTFHKSEYLIANDLSNLMTLCNRCHSSIEPKRAKRQDAEVLA